MHTTNPTQPPTSVNRYRHTAWIVLIGGILITAGATLSMNASVRRIAERDFISLADEIKRTVSKRLDDHARILIGGAAFFQAADEVTRETWRVYCSHQQVDKQLPGIQGMGYALLISPSELDRHIQKIRSEGFPEYTVKPAGDRDIYSSIIYLEPFSGRNLRAFGYDMLSEPVRRAAMERARDTDAPALSGKVTLVQETDQDVQAGTLMYVPVYRKGLPLDTVSQRRAAIIGWVYSPYRMNDLLQGILGDRNLRQDKNLYLTIYDDDLPSPQGKLYGELPSEKERRASAVRFARQIPIDFNGHHWLLCYAETSAGLLTADYIRVWLTLVGGLLITSLLFALVCSLLSTRADAQRMAEELTADLQRSELSYRNQFALNSAVMLLIDAGDGSIIDANDAALSYYGYPRERFLAMNISDINMLPANDVNELRTSVGVERGKRFQFQHRLADGSIRDVDVSASRIPFGGRTVLHSIIQDNTDLKQAERALQAKTALLEAKLNATLDGVLVVDSNQKRLLINQRMVALFNIPPHLLKDDDDAALLAHVTSLTINPERFREKVLHLYAHTAEVSRDDIELANGMLLDRFSAPVLGKDGTYFGRIWTFRDITDRKRLETSLREVSDRLSMAARAGGVGIWDYDVVNNRLQWDDQMFRLYGITREQFGGAYEAWQEGVHPDDRQRGDDEIQLALRGKKEFDIEFRVLWPDGSVHHIRGFASVQRDDSGRPLRMIGTNWDITAAKLSHDSYRQQAALINSLLDSIPDIIFFKDVNGVYLGCNPAFAELVAQSKDAIVGKTDYDLFDREIADSFRVNDRLMLDLGEARHNEESITYTDGRIKLIDTLKTPYWGPDGKLIGILGISRDITERRQAEDALRKSEEQVSLLLNSTAEAIYGVDLQGNCTFANPACVRMLGYANMEQLLGKNMHALIHHAYPDGRPMPVDVCRIYHAFREGKDVHVDDEVLWRADGTRFPVEYWSYPVSLDGEVTGSVVTFIDITERRKAAEALRESESNFRTFFETMTDMIMVGTPAGQILFTNASVTQTLGFTPNELKGMHLLELHPADLRHEAENIFAAMFRGERMSCPLPLARKDGVLIPVETRIWVGKWNGADCMFGVCKNLSAEQDARQRFERLFRSNPSLIALVTLPDRQLTDVNDTFLSVLGYSLSECLGKTTTDLNLFVHPERHRLALEQLFKDEQISGIELQVRRKDGAVLDGLFSCEVICSQGRRYILIVMTDITERKKSELEFARLSVIQRELMHLATDFVNVPLERQDYAIDQSLATMGALIHADRAYLFAYDFAIGRMTNTHEWCEDGITPEIENLQDVPTESCPDWVAAHRQGEPFHIPSVIAMPADSKLRQILEPQGIRSLITLPLMQGSGCLGFVGFDAVRTERIWRDEEVSLLRVLAELYAHFEARRAAERETLKLQKFLMEARDAAQSAALAKSMFLANMSHEIRTPLNAILGYTQIMGRECQACPMGHRLKAITRSGEYLLELLTDLLELVRSDAHNTTLTPSSFDLYQALEDVRIMFARNPAAQTLTLDVSHASDVPRFICADSGKVRQILVNLVGNAFKFTMKGYVRLFTSVLAKDSLGGVTLAVDVKDTGCGIAKKDIERIFKVFEQTESSRKSGKGTGLGLHLSQRYARALGGDITVTSRVGEGSCFRFTFHAEAVSADSIEQPRNGRVLRLAAGQRARRVLVVDDDPSSRDILAALLEPVGFTVKAVASARQALDWLSAAETVDLVLIDKQMPEMDGYEAIGRLRQLSGGREIPVLVVTASGFSDEGKKALAAGANGLISKPVRRERLLEEIGRVGSVQYDYEEAEVVTAVAARFGPEALAQLPAKHLSDLDQAVRRGDILMLRTIVTSIARDHAELAAGIRTLVDTYNYDHLRRLLDAAKGNPV